MVTTRPSMASAWRERGGPMTVIDCDAVADPAGVPLEADPCFTVPAPNERFSVYAEGDIEAQRYKWIESERVGYDLGEAAVRNWVRCHWQGYLRAAWLEHLEGKRFWVELDKGDYGLLKHAFRDQALLLDRILDRLKVGQENLNILLWAHEWGIPVGPVVQILEVLDFNLR